MSTDNQIEQEIQAKGLTAPRVTPADIEANIASEHYFSAADGVAGKACGGFYHMSQHPVDGNDPMIASPDHPLSMLTFCVLVLKNGAKVVGINYGAIDPAQHSAERGRTEARNQAVDKVYELLGFRLRDELSRPVLTEADALADLNGTRRPDNHREEV